jgi:molecular chaperone GrpE
MDQQTNENEETKVAPEEVKAEEVETEAEATEETKEAKENEEYKTKFLYLAAEFENMKKRFEREKSDLLKYGSEKLLKSMVEVVDNLKEP